MSRRTTPRLALVGAAALVGGAAQVPAPTPAQADDIARYGDHLSIVMSGLYRYDLDEPAGKGGTEFLRPYSSDG